MDTATFEELLLKVTPLIIKQDTYLRKSIPPAERLSLTLRHLATGKYFLCLISRCYIYASHTYLIIMHLNSRLIKKAMYYFFL